MSETEVVRRAIIREARPEDDAAIGELLVDAYVTQYAVKMPEIVYTEERKRALRDVAGKRAVAKVLVAEVDGEVAGTVALFPPGAPGSESWTPNTANLRHLATAVRYHGTGLSRPLLDAAERLGREWGVDAVSLHVRREVHGVANLYQRRGYVRTPEGDLDTATVFLEAYLLRLPPTPSLYADLLGPGWVGLPARVRRLHQEGSAAGRFAIHRAPGPLSALVGWLCRFPAAGKDVPTRLVVRREGAAQRWERSFGGHALATWQRAWKSGLLAEKLGPIECVFQLRAVERGITYEQMSAWLCLGPWSLPLPGALSPRIDATTVDTPQGMQVRVSIGTILTGWLLTYEGLIRPKEESP